LVEGAAGVGKSSLLGEAGELARRDGAAVAVAGGSELETSLSFGVARQLFEPLMRTAPDSAELTAGTGPAAALLSGDAPTRELDELELLNGLYRLVANLADRAPVLLAVDDVHWADTPSLRFLLYLAQRLPSLPVVLLTARRTDEPGAPEDLLARLELDRSARRLAVEPLTPDASARIVEERLPGAAPELAEACFHATRGNPFYLRELLESLAQEEVEPDAAGAARVELMTPESVLRATMLRLGRLPEGARELARAAAVLGPDAALRHAAALSGLPVERAARAADALAAAGILAPGEPLSFTHPLLRSAVAADLPDGERALAHRRAAELLHAEGAATERVAAHLLGAPRVGDAWTVERLRTAALEALGRGAASPAARYLARALEEPPGEERTDVLVELGEAEALADEPTAIARLEEAVALTDDAGRRAEVLYRLGLLLYRGSRLTDALAVFRGALDECPARSPLRPALRTAWIGVAALVAPDALDQFRSDATRPPPPTGDPPSAAERELLTQHAVARVFAGEDAAGAADLAARATGDGTMLRENGLTLSFSIAVSCLYWTDELAAAEREVAAGLEAVRAVGSPAMAAYVIFGRAQIRYYQGRVSEAAADAQTAIEIWRGGWSLHLPSAACWLALSLVELGDLDGAAAAVEVGDAGMDVSDDFYGGMLAHARGRLALRRGDAAAAVGHLEDVERRTPGSAYLYNPSLSAWRSDAALAAARTGDDERARRLADTDLEVARRFGAARGLGIALRTAAVIEGGECGVELARESVAAVEGSQARLEHAKSLVALGVLLRAAGNRREARGALREGLDLARGLGAHALRERANVELAAAGARPRREALSGLEALTPSERRVAELAAAGRSNPEIASELFVTRKTVEWHLQHVYRKLGIGSRDELPAALGDAR
jgi:DNA-binding CsgD family transcriptional regulator